MKISVLSWIVKKLRSCLAIVQDTDTATRNIAAGKYVIWKGSMKKALSAITQGDTLSSTNLGDVTDGVANELSVKSVTQEFTTNQYSNVNLTSALNITKEQFINAFHAYVSGNVYSVLPFDWNGDMTIKILKNGVDAGSNLTIKLTINYI